MKKILQTVGASALILTTVGLTTSAHADRYGLAVYAGSSEDLVHHTRGRSGGRGDGVFGGAFPFSFRHGAFNYGNLGPRAETLREQGRFGYGKIEERRRNHSKRYKRNRRY